MPTANSDNSKKRLILFCGMLLLGAVLMMVYSCLTGNTNQKFTDVVMEYTAIEGSNKSAERSLFYIFGIAGALLYTLVFLFRKWGADSEETEFRANKYVWVALAVSLVTNYFFYQKANWLVLSAIFISLIMTKKNERLLIPAVSFFFISVYSICGLYRIYAQTGVAESLSIKTI